MLNHTPECLRAVLVGDPSLSRDGLAALLKLERGIEVVATIALDAEAVKAAVITRPEVVITEFSPATGAQLVLALRARWLEARILVLSAQSDNRAIEAALRAGVDGYLRSSDSRSELLAAIRSLARGERYISRSTQECIGIGGAETRAALAARKAVELLSEREREVMQCVAAGLRTREIAMRLSLSHKTVEKHRSNLMRKLGLRSATAVAAYAAAHGYIR